MGSRRYFKSSGLNFATLLRLKYLESVMSGTAVFVIIVLALVVVVGGSILVLSLIRRDHRMPSDSEQANNDGESPTASDQQSDRPAD